LRWGPVDQLSDEDWHEEIVMLASNIDNARAHFNQA
jgi:hypothetical protein